MGFVLTGDSYGDAVVDIEYENEQKAKRGRGPSVVSYGRSLPQEQEVRHTIPAFNAGRKYRFDKLKRTSGEGILSFEMYFHACGVLASGRPLYLFRRTAKSGVESFTEQQLWDYKITPCGRRT